MAIRRCRIDQPYVKNALDALQNFGMDEYHVKPQDSLALAVLAQIRASDAQYLVLAHAASAPLWTLDTRLRCRTNAGHHRSGLGRV